MGAVSARTSHGYSTKLPDWHTTLPGVLRGPPGGAFIPSHGVDTHTVCCMAAYPVPIQQHHEELPGSHPTHPLDRGSQDGRDGAVLREGKEKGEGNKQDLSSNHAGDPGGTEGVATPP